MSTRCSLSCLAVTAALSGFGAALAITGSAAAAGWSPVQTLGRGKPLGNAATFSPLQLAAGRSGDVALAYQGRGSTVLLARRATGSTFSSPQTLMLGVTDSPNDATPLRPSKDALLAGLATADQSVVLVGLNPDASQFAQVQRVPGTGLTAPQQLVSAGAGHDTAGSVSVTATPRGEVLAEERPSLHNEFEELQTLAPNATRFGPAQKLGRFGCGDDAGDPLAVDGQGTAFLLALSGCRLAPTNVLRVARRPALGTPHPVGSTPCPGGCPYVVSAAGDGEVAAATAAGHTHPSVRLAVGRHGGLGSFRGLGRFSRQGSAADTTLNAPSVTSSGTVTFSWMHCQSSDGIPCTLSAVRATTTGRFGGPQQLVKTTPFGDSIDAVDGPREVFAATCEDFYPEESHCVLREWAARPGLRFGPGQTIARRFALNASSRPLTLDTDAAGDEILPLSGENGSVEALVRAAGSRRFTMHQLAARKTFPLGSLTAVVTRDRQAVIAWMSLRGTVQTATYTFSNATDAAAAPFG